MRALALSIVLLAFLTACGGDSDGDDVTVRGGSEAAGTLDFGEVETVVTGLEVPWDLAFVDETTFLVTERPGRVRLVEDGRLRDEPVAEIDVRSESEAGLLGIALHPDFPDERFAYIYYTSASDNRVVRYELGDDFRFGSEDVVVDGIPAGPNHDGGRIAFGPDGMLYIGTGDAGDGRRAADRTSLAGKILRLAPDGSVPDDNPFEGSAVYSYGHRNVQGLGWDSDGQLFAAEHGPTGEAGLCCHDEVNRVEEGDFYGWPFRAGESPAESGDPPQEPVAPAAESGDETWAPSGLAVEGADDETAVLLATLGSENLLRFAWNGSELEAPDVALEGYGRLRAATFGPDDCLYVSTSNRDGRGSPSEEDDRILKTCPSM